MQEQPTRKFKNYRIPFFASALLCLALTVVLVIVLLPGQKDEASISMTKTEGEIVEFLSDDLYFSLLVVHPEEGDDVTVKITPETTVFDEYGKPVLWSGLTVEMKICVYHTNKINAYSLYKEDWTPVPPILEECHEIHIVSS